MQSYTNPLIEYSPQMETFEFSPENRFEGSRLFSEAEELELAAELLGVNNEQELEQFLGDLIKKAGNLVGNVVNSPIGKAVGGALKTVAKSALPIVGGAAGTFLGGPIGGMIGSNLAGMAGQALGLELEGLSPEDRDMEASKQFVRLAGETVKNALQSPAGSNPAAIASAALKDAARVHTPGLSQTLHDTDHGSRHHRPHSGRWVREHGRVVVFGI